MYRAILEKDPVYPEDCSPEALAIMKVTNFMHHIHAIHAIHAMHAMHAMHAFKYHRLKIVGAF